MMELLARSKEEKRNYEQETKELRSKLEESQNELVKQQLSHDGASQSLEERLNKLQLEVTNARSYMSEERQSIDSTKPRSNVKVKREKPTGECEIDTYVSIKSFAGNKSGMYGPQQARDDTMYSVRPNFSHESDIP